MVEYLSTSFVDCADSSSKLRVGIARDVLRQEVDEPAVALQQRKHLHGTIESVRGLFNFASRHPRNRTGRLGLLLCDVVGNVSVEQDRKETSKGKCHSFPKSVHGSPVDQ